MLVLTRRRNEAVVLTLPSGDPIRVVVTDIVGSQVRLGFDAPANVQIERVQLRDGSA
jgi:carbon storage regulator CsrA